MRKTNLSEWLFSVALSLGQSHGRIGSSKRKWRVNPISASMVLAAFLVTAVSAGATDTLPVIHEFAGGNGGNSPNWLIQASDGNFYGTTYLGVGTGHARWAVHDYIHFTSAEPQPLFLRRLLHQRGRRVRRLSVRHSPWEQQQPEPIALQDQ